MLKEDLVDLSLNTPYEAPDGPFYGGAYDPVYYKYPPDDELFGGTWEEGLRAINDFDWGSDEHEGHSPQKDPHLDISSLLLP